MLSRRKGNEEVNGEYGGKGTQPFSWQPIISYSISTEHTEYTEVKRRQETRPKKDIENAKGILSLIFRVFRVFRG